MAFLRALFFVFSAVQLATVDAADCSKMADFKPMECCKFPEFKGPDVDKMKETVTKVGGEKSMDDYLSECKLVEATFKEFKFSKDTDIDTSELEKFFDKSLTDAEWKPVMQAAIKTCKTKTDAKAADIVKKMEAAPFNVKKDQCNAKFTSFIVCLKVEAFGNCPKGKWTDNASCAAGKTWVADCGKDFDSLKEMYSKKA